nr:hypothetical protein [Pyrobaculum sp.]
MVHALSQAAAYGPIGVQLSAIEALGKLGPQAAGAASTLAAILARGRDPAAAASREAILRMDPAAAPYPEDRLKTYLEREDRKAALAVANVLLELGVSSASTVFAFALSFPFFLLPWWPRLPHFPT